MEKHPLVCILSHKVALPTLPFTTCAGALMCAFRVTRLPMLSVYHSGLIILYSSGQNLLINFEVHCDLVSLNTSFGFFCCVFRFSEQWFCLAQTCLVFASPLVSQCIFSIFLKMEEYFSTVGRRGGNPTFPILYEY